MIWRCNSQACKYARLFVCMCKHTHMAIYTFRAISSFKIDSCRFLTRKVTIIMGSGERAWLLQDSRTHLLTRCKSLVSSCQPWFLTGFAFSATACPQVCIAIYFPPLHFTMKQPLMWEKVKEVDSGTQIRWGLNFHPSHETWTFSLHCSAVPFSQPHLGACFWGVPECTGMSAEWDGMLQSLPMNVLIHLNITTNQWEKNISKKGKPKSHLLCPSSPQSTASTAVLLCLVAILGSTCSVTDK